jgi:hypothetical protein
VYQVYARPGLSVIASLSYAIPLMIGSVVVIAWAALPLTAFLMLWATCNLIYTTLALIFMLRLSRPRLSGGVDALRGLMVLAAPLGVGALLLGEETGAQFNLIPLSGGRNTIAGVVTGETDIGVLPSGSVVSAGDAVRALLVWDDKNPIPDQLANAPTMNGHFGTDAPPLVSSRAFGIHSSTIEDAPDAFAKLVETGKAAFDDPAFAEAAEKANQPLEILDYGGLEECNAAAESMIELAQRYKDLLAGNA